MTRPRLPAVHLRHRLFKLLDQSLRAPVVWLEGAPGAGKTTLAASWLDAGKRPCVWYQVDAGDADAATFFHYLGLAARQAAPRYRQPLPHFTPEYTAGLETFARRFFADFFRRLPERTVLVLDNVQEAATDAFQTVLRLAFEAIPEHVRVLCLSRHGPAPIFARLKTNGELAHLEPEVMRLSIDEAQAVARLHGAVDRSSIPAIHAQTDGWTAGFVLMLGRRTAAFSAAGDGTPQALFDYFMGEILLQLDETRRSFLLKTALLPTMRVADAAALVDGAEAGAILADLVRRNYFTYQRSPRESVYEYHPLFREFLLKRLEQTLPPSDLAQLRSAAGRLLEAAGEAENAAELYRAAGDWSSLAVLVRLQAQQLILEGRSQTVESWIRALPDAMRASDGWLEYWFGTCRLPYDPPQARTHYANAFALFGHTDAVGLYTAWAGVIDTFMYEWGDFSRIDPWVAELEGLRARHPHYPSAEIEVRVTMAMLGALTWRFPGHPALTQWADAALRIVLANAGSRLSMLIGNHLVFYSLWDGEFPKAAAVIEALRPHAAKLRNDPLALLHWYVMDAMYAWFSADHRKCLAAVDAGNRVAAEAGIHLLDIYLNAQGVYSAVSVGDRKTARECVQRMIAAQPSRMLDKSLCQYMLASVAWLERDYRRAIEHGEAAIRLAEATHSTLGLGLCEIELAMTFFEVQRNDDAAKYLERGSASNRGRRFMEFLGDLRGAAFALARGNEAHAIERLRQAMHLGARQGYVNTPRWDPEAMGKLCALALAHDIEPDYVRMLIVRRELPPPAAGIDADAWPWPVRIGTLGGFEFTLRDRPPPASRKQQRKPLELLKLLVAAGEQGLSAAQAAESLMPETSPERAQQSYTAALHRLRKLLQNEGAVLASDGRVRLNPKVCWVDAWAFEKMWDEAARENDDVAGLRGLNRASRLYGGPFLKNEELVYDLLTYRERLHRRYIEGILAFGRRAEARGQWETALGWYRQGIVQDDLAEAFYQRILVCCKFLGYRAEGLAVYEQCRQRLQAALGITPSSQTRSLRDALLAS